MVYEVYVQAGRQAGEQEVCDGTSYVVVVIVHSDVH